MEGICREVPFAFLLEPPDAASANLRKQEKTSGELPSNCGHIKSKCSCHQGHRIVESREKRQVGNVYAACFTCSAVSHQSRMQESLWSVLGEMDFHVGYPNPEWRKHSAEAIRHTVLRREQFLGGRIHDDGPVSLRQFPHVVKFLTSWNGDWTQRRVAFWTATLGQGRHLGKWSSLARMARRRAAAWPGRRAP